MLNRDWREVLSPIDAHWASSDNGHTWHARAIHNCGDVHGLCALAQGREGEPWVRWQSPESDPDGCLDCLLVLAKLLVPMLSDKQEQMEMMVAISSLEEYQRLCRDVYERRN